MNITVLGAGAGGTTVAFDCAAHGHQVSLFDFPQFPGNIAAIAEQGGIHAEGDISGFNAVAYAGHDIDRALENAELVYVVGPAFSTEPFGQALAGKLVPGQTVIVTPGSCGGALAFKRAAGLAVEDESIRVAETHTLHYAVRLSEPGRVHVFLKLKAGNLLAALPGRQTANILDLIYEEGVTDSVGRIIESVDRERIAIGERLGMKIFSDPEMGMRQGYMLENNYGSGYREAPGFLGIPAQPQLDHRYINEDVGYGLVFMSQLGKQVGVETPTIDSIIRLASVLMNRDYAGEALRTPASLGIDGLTPEQIAGL